MVWYEHLICHQWDVGNAKKRWNPYIPQSSRSLFGPFYFKQTETKIRKMVSHNEKQGTWHISHVWNKFHGKFSLWQKDFCHIFTFCWNCFRDGLNFFARFVFAVLLRFRHLSFTINHIALPKLPSWRSWPFK